MAFIILATKTESASVPANPIQIVLYKGKHNASFLLSNEKEMAWHPQTKFLEGLILK